MISDQEQANSHYNVDLHILPEKGSLQAKVALFYSVVEKANCYLEFYLHKGVKIRTVNGSVPLNYRFDVDHPFSFTPESRILSIELKRPLEENELLHLSFEYEGDIGLTTFEVNRITPSWVELSHMEYAMQVMGLSVCERKVLPRWKSFRYGETHKK